MMQTFKQTHSRSIKGQIIVTHLYSKDVSSKDENLISDNSILTKTIKSQTSITVPVAESQDCCIQETTLSKCKITRNELWVPQR